MSLYDGSKEVENGEKNIFCSVEFREQNRADSVMCAVRGYNVP